MTDIKGHSDQYLDGTDDYAVINSVISSMKQWHSLKHKKLLNRHRAVRSLKVRRRIRRDEEEVCYENFGCFRDEGPFDYLDTLPASPEVIGTSFTLYTRENPKSGEQLDYNDAI
ncbi:pancreatic triacylglycerol lipase-like protein, partial [Leptotrombidium deliense]